MKRITGVTALSWKTKRLLLKGDRGRGLDWRQRSGRAVKRVKGWETWSGDRKGNSITRQDEASKLAHVDFPPSEIPRVYK